MFGFDPAVGVEDEVEGALLEDAGVEGELPVAEGVGVVGFGRTGPTSRWG